jgi:HlyD family secretion protein
VVELPWPEDKDGRPEAERGEARESRPRDRQPEAKGRAQREKQKPVQPPARGRIWSGVWTVISGLIVLAVVAALVWWAIRPTEPKTSYTLTKPAVGTIMVAAHAQGLLAARNPVDVVAPSGGRLDGAVVNSGDHVRQGQILARLNSESARANIVDVSADVASSQSAAARADVDVEEARADLTRARSSTRAGAEDSAQARLARAVARANEARALLGAAKARLAAARLRGDNLLVRAPFDGIVLRSNLDTSDRARTVARGQILFTLVRDLSTFDLTAYFPENAIGKLHVGQRASFTVAAFPHRTFSATLSAVGIWPQVLHRATGNDVTVYPITLSVTKPGERLLPGLNADVAVILAQAKDVLTVSNAALIFRPAESVEAKYPPPKGAPAAAVPLSVSAPGNSAASLGPLSSPAGSWSPVVLSSAPRPGRVWVLEGKTPRPRDIMVGMSDGNITQVVSGELRPGDSVITSAIVQARSGASQS